jgi:hypothetical protein
VCGGKGRTLFVCGVLLKGATTFWHSTRRFPLRVSGQGPTKPCQDPLGCPLPTEIFRLLPWKLGISKECAISAAQNKVAHLCLTNHDHERRVPRLFVPVIPIYTLQRVGDREVCKASKPFARCEECPRSLRFPKLAHHASSGRIDAEDYWPRLFLATIRACQQPAAARR